MVKSRRMKWAKHVARMGGRGFGRIARKKVISKNTDVSGKILLKWIKFLIFT
jgi:hypothetical protein